MTEPTGRKNMDKLIAGLMGIASTAAVGAVILLFSLNVQTQLNTATLKRLDDNSAQYITRSEVDLRAGQRDKEISTINNHLMTIDTRLGTLEQAKISGN